MGVHLVSEPDGRTVLCLSTESVPELVCEDTLQRKDDGTELIMKKQALSLKAS